MTTTPTQELVKRLRDDCDYLADLYQRKFPPRAKQLYENLCDTITALEQAPAGRVMPLEPTEYMLLKAEVAYAVPWVRPMANAYKALLEAAPPSSPTLPDTGVTK